MNPYLTILEVLRHLLDGQQAVGAVQCSPCIGAACCICGGAGSVPLTTLASDEPEWRVEAEMILAEGAPIGMRSRVLRTVVMPIVQANKVMADDEVAIKRRAQQARDILARCSAEDWRRVALAWVDQQERGT